MPIESKSFKIYKQDSSKQWLEKKLLIVEDNLLNQEISRYMVEQLGYQVDIAENGKQALEMCNDGYDCILLDIGLPDIDGREVCKIIRNKYKLTHIPIIAFTTHDKVMFCGWDECICHKASKYH